MPVGAGIQKGFRVVGLNESPRHIPRGSVVHVGKLAVRGTDDHDLAPQPAAQLFRLAGERLAR